MFLQRAPRAGGTPAAFPEFTTDQIEALRPEVVAFCGDCHAVPSPSSFPKDAWSEEVRQGFDFYLESERNDLKVPPVDVVLTYFRSQAPVKVLVPTASDDPSPPSVRFRPTATALDSDAAARACISSLSWQTLEPGRAPELIVCDMRSGEIRTTRPDRHEIVLRTIGRLQHPAHAVPVDLDADGRLDLVVADLGGFFPADHSEGRVVWLQRTEAGDFEPVVLQAGLGRVADVEPGDFDADGDIDLIVAEFGWHKTGRILLLDNQTLAGQPPQFEPRVIDSRHGTIHVPTVDLNGDGRLDFVALISQEHESVEAFFNDGAGDFQRAAIFVAGEPAFGSSGIELIDLDGDGDLDVLHTNGDTFDSTHLKPFHGIRWIENLGNASFAVHHLTAMPGVHRALAADLDGDGDLDIAACALLPEKLLGPGAEFQLDALIWLEQTAPGRFARHSLLRGKCHHPAMELGDFDADGRIDIAVGGFSITSSLPQVTVWWNHGPPQGAAEAGRAGENRANE